MSEDTRKERFDWLLDGHHDATIKAHVARHMLKKAKIRRTDVFTGKPYDIAAAEADCVNAENEIAEIAAELWEFANQASAPSTGTDSKLLAVLDLVAQYGQAQVALSQTRTPHTRTAATAKANSIWDSLKTALQEG